MKHSELTNQPKRDHSVVVKDFFGEGQNLEIWQLGWDIASKIEAKTSVGSVSQSVSEASSLKPVDLR